MLLLSTFGYCLLSAVFPLANAEAYLGALAATDHGGSTVWLLAATASAGQTVGKVAFYSLGRSSLNWAWVRKKTETVKWQARLAKWQETIHGKRWAATALLLASAFLGIPPLAVVSVIAGQLKSPLPLFVVAVFVGRTMRFAALLGGVDALVGH
jgi:membrane protein YqaA with SNARE-associated domain